MNQFSTYDQLSCGYGKRNQNEQKQCSKKKLKILNKTLRMKSSKSIEGTHIRFSITENRKIRFIEFIGSIQVISSFLKIE